MIIEKATEQDIEAWLELAKEVEPLFGPMAAEPSFWETLKKTITKGRGFCIREYESQPGAPLCGAIIISCNNNEIGWLAVAKRHRRKGVGKALLSYAIEKLDKRKPISVNTFAETVIDGIPARMLYSRFGFKEVQKLDPNPAGIPIVKMLLQVKSNHHFG